MFSGGDNGDGERVARIVYYFQVVFPENEPHHLQNRFFIRKAIPRYPCLYFVRSIFFDGDAVFARGKKDDAPRLRDGNRCQ